MLHALSHLNLILIRIKLSSDSRGLALLLPHFVSELLNYGEIEALAQGRTAGERWSQDHKQAVQRLSIFAP